MAAPDGSVVGWDIGGAHVKACWMQPRRPGRPGQPSQGGEVLDVAQWACPLWLGMDRLTAVLEAARARWPALGAAAHAVTMTGELVDLFTDREDGVRRIAAELQRCLVPSGHGALRFFAGDAGWCGLGALPAQWEAVASANWLATARHAALRFGNGVLIDIGSTTTDLIAFRGGRVATRSRTDAQRLACGELVCHGVVRTPLCAFAPRIAWHGAAHNVMNEFFASAADVYRLTGELDPAHDVSPSADNAPKDLPATRQRLARMVGLDARDGSPADWLAFAHAWRAAQVAELGGQLRRVLAAHAMGADAVVVSAGCGDFLAADVLSSARAGSAGCAPAATLMQPRVAAYGREVAHVALQATPNRGAVQAWAQVCAPCVAVAALFEMDQR